MTTVIEANALIRKAFPQIPAEFYDILNERIKANKFTDERLVAAVNHVIDTWTNTYTHPNIGNFISFDKKIKVFNNVEMQQLAVKEGLAIYKYYQLVKIGKKIVYAHNDDIQEYNLEIFIPKPAVAKHPEKKRENVESWKGFAKKVIGEK